MKTSKRKTTAKTMSPQQRSWLTRRKANPAKWGKPTEAKATAKKAA